MDTESPELSEPAERAELTEPVGRAGSEPGADTGAAVALRAVETLFAGLSRSPDLDAPELRAYDAADRLLLTVAAPHLGAARSGDVVVIGDTHGSLTLAAASAFGVTGIRVFQDQLLGERALAQNAKGAGLEGTYSSHELDEKLLSGATLVLMRLPRSLDELREAAEAIARWADPAVTVLAGGRDKHMSRGMNDVLADSFVSVSASHGAQKSRVLTAHTPQPGAAGAEPSFPAWGVDRAIPFRLAAFGATFGGARLDHGSRLLLETLGDAAARARHIADIGCGNGVLAVSAALQSPGAQVIASDQSRSAIAATALTAGAAGVDTRIDLFRADGAEAIPDGWADLILLNPPFHTGSTVHAGVAHRIIRSCARALAPGGELRIVFNSHLRYRPLVEQAIGPVREVARNRTFTVLSAIHRE